MACRHEHHEHGGDDHGDHHHDHSHDDPERGLEGSLLSSIDLTSVRCLNATDPDAAQRVFKPYDQKRDRQHFVESDADEQMIIYIPFTDNVKIKTIEVIGEPGEKHPAKMKVFKNRDDIDFENVEDIEPLQEWEMVDDPEGNAQYYTRITHFQGLHSLTIFFSDNFGADSTKIFYIGLTGESTKVHRRTVITLAEFAARPEDHKNETKADQGMSKPVS